MAHQINNPCDVTKHSSIVSEKNRSVQDQMTNTQLQKKKDGKDNSMAEHFTQISQQEAVN